MNNNLIAIPLSVIFSITLSACGEEQHEDQAVNNIIAEDQLKALEEAKGVEQLLLDAAKQRRESTE